MNEYCLNFFGEFEKQYQNFKTTNSDIIAHRATELIETRSKELFKWLKNINLVHQKKKYIFLKT